MKNRDKIIIRTSIIGIMANCLLALFKAIVGTISGSIAIVLDAVNNLSDAFSSVITIIGTKLAGKAPDKKHPMGHGRVEYISSALISMVVLYAGITSFIESVKEIVHPVTPEYTSFGLIIVAVAVVVKIVLGTYVKKTGEEVNSGSLIASGEDAKLDSIISASTLVAAGIFIVWGISLEAWLGAIISIIIIKAGYDMLSDTVSHILGERVGAELSHDIKRTVSQFPEVHGAYDLTLHSYGPDRYVGSIHIEVPEDMTIARLDQLEREITHEVYSKHGVMLESVGIYSRNANDTKAGKLRNDIANYARRIEYVKQIHGFYYDELSNRVSFDLVIDFAAGDIKRVFADAVKKLEEKYPDIVFDINMDIDLSD
ncbi:MAG: cation diffusion facilitator family transporter [Pseudobutyrivibrio sp.]|nr:cation diffusion facilitator family transporter [Pseudobutyrivibrio sp.]